LYRRFKRLAELVGFVWSLPHLARYALARPMLGEAKAFAAASEHLARIPGMLGVYARRAFYRRTLAAVGRDVYIGYMSLFSKPDARLGDNVFIGRFCTVGQVSLEDEAMVGDGVQLLSGRHQHGRESRDGRSLQSNPQEFVRVVVGRGAWLGAGSIIMADVGECAVVGAGAVVVKAVPPHDKVVGNPARSVKSKGAMPAACERSRTCAMGEGAASALEPCDLAGEPARKGCRANGACPGAGRPGSDGKLEPVFATRAACGNTTIRTEMDS